VPSERCSIEVQLIEVWMVRVVLSDVVQHTTSLDTTRTIHHILSTAPQLSISQKVLGTLPEDDNVMSKHVGATVHK
jgi:hypothetical protein